MTDEELMQQLNRDDQSAFLPLYERQSVAVRKIAVGELRKLRTRRGPPPERLPEDPPGPRIVPRRLVHDLARHDRAERDAESREDGETAAANGSPAG